MEALPRMPGLQLQNGGKVMSWYDMHECVCIGCKEIFRSIEKMNVCLPCFEAQLANEDK
jgi:hypothetical protein